MVAFNPDVPDQRDPNYLRYSQPISQPEGDKSAIYSGESAKYAGQVSQHLGEAAQYAGKAAEFAGQGLGDLFKGIGDVFTSGIKAADQFVKKNIDQDVYSAVDAQRNEYTAQLERTSSPDSSGQVIDQGTMPAFVRPGTKPPGPAMDLTGSNAGNVPQSIDKGLSRIDTLVAARANDKMTETMYIGQLDSIAKELRARYPGYREYIDQKISESTGMIPANAYIKSLIQDINAASASTKSEYDKAFAAIAKEVEKGTPNSRAYMDRLRATGDVSGTFDFIEKVNAQNYYWDNRKRFYENNKLGRDDLKASAAVDLDQLAPQIIDSHINGILARTGIGTGSIKTFEDLVQNHIQGTGPRLDTPTMQQLGTIMQSQSIDLQNAIRAEAIKNGMYQRIGAEDAEKQITAHVARWNQMAKFIYDDKMGPAALIKNQNGAIVEDLHNNVLTNKDIGPYARFAEMAEKIGPNYSQKFFTNSVISESALSKKVDGFVKGIASQMATQAERPQELIRDGKPITFKDGIQKLADTGNGTQTATNAVLKNFNWFYNPQVEDSVKRGYAMAAFDPANRGMLQLIQKDYKDPRTNKPVKGQIDVFENFTNPEVTKEITRLGKSSPQLVKNYRDWADNEFQNVLFRQDLATLRDIQLNPGMSISFNSDTGQFALNKTRTPKFDPNNNIPSRSPDVVAARMEIAGDTINRLNRGLASMKNINDATGEDNNAYVTRLLTSHGVDVRNVGGMRIPEQMLNSVIHSQKSNFGPEENAQRGSLSEFLRAPAGNLPTRTQNAPAASVTRSRGTSTNLTDQGDILGQDTTDIPPGVSPQEWIRVLENARRVR